MNVALVDVDGHGFPNLALMRLAAWHKQQGDAVEWYSPLFSRPDRLYSSKVFTFTPDCQDFAANAPTPIRGGTGYDPTVTLPDEVEQTLPDYSIYPDFTPALGFLTRGCIRSCPWCVVPRKEGNIRIADDIGRIYAGRREVVLLDNNFLAAPEAFVEEQLRKAQSLKLRIDFNQALDARLVNGRNASLLAETRWIRYIRFSCDNHSMLTPVHNAIRAIRAAGYQREFFVYVLAKEVWEAYDRICRLTDIDRKIVPFCQPFRDFMSGGEPPAELRHLARWCNIQSIRKTVPFREYQPNF